MQPSSRLHGDRYDVSIKIGFRLLSSK